VCEGTAGSGAAAPSVFCSGACEDELLLGRGGLTGGRTAAGLELVRDTKGADNNNDFKCAHVQLNTQ